MESSRFIHTLTSHAHSHTCRHTLTHNSIYVLWASISALIYVFSYEFFCNDMYSSLHLTAAHVQVKICFLIHLEACRHSFKLQISREESTWHGRTWPGWSCFLQLKRDRVHHWHWTAPGSPSPPASDEWRALLTGNMRHKAVGSSPALPVSALENKARLEVYKAPRLEDS